jgi:hypothetical protein
MYTGKQPIFVINQECNCTVTQVTDQLNAAGYSVMRSFDLQTNPDKTSKCICHLVILLVYGNDGPPATLVFDGSDINTFIFLENDPELTTRSRYIALLSNLFTLDQSSERNLDEERISANNSSPKLNEK